jgi:hypothetical protein
LKIDLGSAKAVVCGFISLLSLTASGSLPASVLFEYSTDNSTWYSCAPAAFDCSEYSNAAAGQRYLAYFTDLNKSARYIRATITNIASTNTVIADEFTVYAGATPSLVSVETINGYLGESIDADNGAATISVQFIDRCKRERDMRRIELTKEYKNQLPEYIIYQLLTDPMYWTGAAGAYDAPLTPQEITWASGANLSNFPITKWQGQQGTIADYIDQIAKSIGWIYDADGDGRRRFSEPEFHRLTASPWLNLFGQRWGLRGTVKRHKTGNDIRNYINVTGKNANIGTVTGITSKHSASIAKYGVRYARITEPLANTPDLQQRLGRALLRDFAYARDGVTISAKGDFDITRPRLVLTMNESVRAMLTKSSLFSIESCVTSMTTSGRGEYRSELGLKYYIGAPPPPIADVTGLQQNANVKVMWTASTDGAVVGYHVYWASGNDPAAWTFTKRAAVTAAEDTVTGLTNGVSYWFYVTAVNIDGTESPNSLLLNGVPTASPTGHAKTTDDSWELWVTVGVPVREGADVVQQIELAVSFYLDSPQGTYDELGAVGTVALIGPADNFSPGPVNVHSTFVLQPYEVGLSQYINVRMAYADFTAGDYVYWRVKVHSVKIRGVDYVDGNPPLSNYDASGTVWPA